MGDGRVEWTTTCSCIFMLFKNLNNPQLWGGIETFDIILDKWQCPINVFFATLDCKFFGELFLTNPSINFSCRLSRTLSSFSILLSSVYTNAFSWTRRGAAARARLYTGAKIYGIELNGIKAAAKLERN